MRKARRIAPAGFFIDAPQGFATRSNRARPRDESDGK
jgi:hypothetical protein